MAKDMARDDERIKRLLRETINKEFLVSEGRIFEIARTVMHRKEQFDVERLEATCLSLLKVTGTVCSLAVAVKALIWLWHWCI